MPHFAHSPEKTDPEQRWHLLEDHLRETAELAAQFADAFGGGEWARLAGWWHDAGKYQRVFQVRIGSDPNAHTDQRVDHSSVGALIASERGAYPLTFAIAGHHGGLPNQEDLKARLQEKAHLLPEARRGGLPDWLEQQAVPGPPAKAADEAEWALWMRFVFSALVDADFLDTERFYAGDRERDLGPQPMIAELKRRLDEFLKVKSAAAFPTPMNQMRQRVLEACRGAAKRGKGAFTLTVPTGGGKTLASLAFALDHALTHRLRRVIVVIPYTSIIEQTARSYRAALGDEAVIEHHTNSDLESETAASRLASENWDAPIVVTTSVQFFESLFANRPSRCRKLHRIAESVIVFDEVQTFPLHLLTAIRHSLRTLVKRYGVSAVLCTATQPVLLEDASEIMPDPDAEFSRVGKRCEILIPADSTPQPWEALATELREYRQVLAIVHRRHDAQLLAQLTGDDCAHLSARMCARHRSEVLLGVRQRLDEGLGCRLVATQLVEAGVDIDFPEVYRAFAGADSMTQAAGRCNREGKGQGRLHIFWPPTKPPAGVLRLAQDVSRLMLSEGRLNLADRAMFPAYFARLFSRSDPDARAIMTAERGFAFKEAAERFRMIEEAGEPVVAPYGNWRRPVEDVRNHGVTRLAMRRLQPFLVSLYPRETAALFKRGALERIAETFWCVTPGFEKVYHADWGFGWQDPETVEMDTLIA